MKTEDNIISDWLQSNNNPQIEIKVLNELVDKLIQQRDDFAIGFAIWCIDYTYHKSFDVWIKNNNLKAEKFTNKELLEIYKQQKGL
jgi:hypothetical protein